MNATGNTSSEKGDSSNERSNDSAVIFEVLRNALRAKKKTYKDLAEYLNVSELTIKRMFKEQDCKISRLVAVCQFLQINLDELLAFSNRYSDHPQYLSEQVEQALAADRTTFGVLLLIISSLTTDDILRVTQLNNIELYKVLRKLEKLGIIQIQSDNQFIISTPLPIAWRRHGALTSALKRINLKYLAYCFDNHQVPEHHYYSTSRLMSADSSAAIKQKLDEVYRLFQQLATQDQLFHHSSQLTPYKLQIAHSLLPVDELFLE